jgi:hypothetical protein
VEVSDKFNNLSGVISRLDELDRALDDTPVPPFMTEASKQVRRCTLIHTLTPRPVSR